MSFFDDDIAPHLFDNEYRQREDIEELKTSVEAAEQGNIGAIQALGQRLDALEGRLEETTLICESLVELIVSKEWASSEEVAQFIDQIHTERRERRRAATGSGPGTAPAETVRCGGCGETVAKSDSYMTGMGPRCSTCYSG